MRKYEVIEDNGGGLTLVVFDENGNVNYLHNKYEHGTPGKLVNDLKLLNNGADPKSEWDGNEENPQGTYDNIMSSDHGWQIVADNDGIYPKKMGCAACREFGICGE